VSLTADGLRAELLEDLSEYPHYDLAVTDVDGCIPPELKPMSRDSVRALMILAWLRGASWWDRERH